MTDVNSSTVESGTTTSTNINTTGTNTDHSNGESPVASSPNSQRWRFDFDFNFDPSWLVTAGARAHPPLSMLNDWVRNRIPASVGGTQGISANSTERGRPTDLTIITPNASVTSDPANGQHSVAATNLLHIQQGTMINNNLDQASVSRSRSSPVQQRSQTDIEMGANGSGHAGRDSQSYVVQIQPDVHGEWGSSDEEIQPNEEQETEAAADSNERSPPEISQQSPEARAFFNLVERYAPFVLLLLIKGLFDHGSGIICFLALFITFSHANSLLKKEVSKQSKRNLLCLIMISMNLLICIAFIFYVFDDQRLYATFVFLPTNLSLTSIWTLFWLIGVIDYVAKFITVIFKAVVLSLPPRVTPFQKRGKYYLFVEQSSQLYRCLLPIYPWLCFFVEAYDGPLKVFGFLLAGLYGLFKACDLVRCIRAWRISFGKLLQQVHYGTSPSEDELTNAGAQCPICHDAFVFPTRLSCSHIFCEECVSTWFDRERTCPMCRAKVVDDPTYRDGSTTHFIQLF